MTDTTPTTTSVPFTDRDLYEPSPSAGYATVRRVYGLDLTGGDR